MGTKENWLFVAVRFGMSANESDKVAKNAKSNVEIKLKAKFAQLYRELQMRHVIACSLFVAFFVFGMLILSIFDID